ncbi:hypothetical protein Rs2_27396 [Raphanus sativus]|nr:hypothetical protein Rs2_47159 [Raphanus sativus]KAJ4887648.1 hypothetical protein Rs2_27396 [Raphanus sativus]
MVVAGFRFSQMGSSCIKFLLCGGDWPNSCEGLGGTDGRFSEVRALENDSGSYIFNTVVGDGIRWSKCVSRCVWWGVMFPFTASTSMEEEVRLTCDSDEISVFDLGGDRQPC